MRTEDVIKDSNVGTRIALDGLSTETLESMAAAGEEIFNIHRILTKTGDNVVGELLKGHETFYEWDHYPPGDVYDHETHAQYYYHAHVPEQRFDGEHGHFHTFVRPKGMPKGMKPADVPGAVMPEDPNDALSHLVAISMSPNGLPFRLFTVNRWVTGEIWYDAADVCKLLDYFVIDHAKPSWPVNRWITAMIVLFKPTIIELVQARDVRVAEVSAQRPGVDIYEDRSFEVTSYQDVDVEKQARAVAKELLRRR